MSLNDSVSSNVPSMSNRMALIFAAGDAIFDMDNFETRDSSAEEDVSLRVHALPFC